MAASVLYELALRDGIDIALSGRDSAALAPVLRFLCRRAPLPRPGPAAPRSLPPSPPLRPYPSPLPASLLFSMARSLRPLLLGSPVAHSAQHPQHPQRTAPGRPGPWLGTARAVLVAASASRRCTRSPLRRGFAAPAPSRGTAACCLPRGRAGMTLRCHPYQ